jgi:hypothetical protein
MLELVSFLLLNVLAIEKGKKNIDGDLFHSIKTCGARRLYVYGIGCSLLFFYFVCSNPFISYSDFDAKMFLVSQALTVGHMLEKYFG